ncbi:glycosyl transferase family 2 [Mesonia algae]|uniref:Glycosyl transferase family 2 n=2 Tax=Mesonia algae TaxID=213248 RepID=A0A2W7JTQ0_9FLAO|nr:glycosyl transferase family 2 [Mesonia algae]
MIGKVMRNNSIKISTYNVDDVEVLVSTMKRTSFSFLEAMFINNDISKLHILIINQTDAHHQLTSNLSNIRVINSEEKGLSKSRNLAIKNAIKPICVIADDDVVYLKGFVNTVAQGHCKYPAAGLISFQAKNFSDKPYKTYNNQEREIIKKRKETPLSSIEVTLKREIIVENTIFFNELFGLGSYFESGEEDLFLKELLSKQIIAFHIPKFIVSHADESSTSNPASNRFIRARAAAKYVEYGNLSLLWMLKFLFFLIRKKHIKASSIIEKYRLGYQAIIDVKKMSNSST